MENFNPELLEKAKQAKSAEELLVLAEENGTKMTEERAKTYYAHLHPTSGELSDEELDSVAGGGCAEKKQGLTAADCPIGSRVRIRGCSVCWNVAKGSRYVLEEGMLPGGCNSTELVVTAFNPQTEMVSMECPKCYRKLCVQFIFVELYL